MAINFDSFTEGTISTIQSNDYVVGFDTAVPGGERKYTLSTIANVVSGLMSTQLNNLFVEQSNFTGTNQNLTTNGYQKLPGGLIIQWAYATESTSITNTRSWPIAFPNAVFLAAANPLDTAGVSTGAAFYSVTTTTFIFRYGDNYNNAQNGFVLGIGY